MSARLELKQGSGGDGQGGPSQIHEGAEALISRFESSADVPSLLESQKDWKPHKIPEGNGLFRSVFLVRRECCCYNIAADETTDYYYYLQSSLMNTRAFEKACSQDIIIEAVDGMLPKKKQVWSSVCLRQYYTCDCQPPLPSWKEESCGGEFAVKFSTAYYLLRGGG